MSQRFMNMPGGDTLLLVDARVANETVPLPRGYATGRRFVVQRMDSSAFTVTVVPPAGESLDGAVDATVLVGVNAEKSFLLRDPTLWESFGAPSVAELSGTYAAKVSRVDADALRATRDAAYRAWDTQINAGGSVCYILGHSVVAGTGASVTALGFASLVKAGIQAVDPTATVTIEGHGGYTSTQLLALFNAVTGPTVAFTSLTIFMGLLNDYYFGIDPELTRSNLLALVAKFKAIVPVGAGTPTFLILTEWLRGDMPGAGVPWASYVAVAKAVADSDPTVAVLDIGARIGGSADPDLLDLFAADQAHPNDNGHAFIARAVLSEVLRGRSGAPAAPWYAFKFAAAFGHAHFRVGTWVPVVNVASIGNGTYVNTSAALNDEINFDDVVGAGNWAFDFVYTKNTNEGIATVSIDDGAGNFTTLGTIDMYAASASYNNIAVMTTVLTGPPIKRRLKIKATSKNASSAGYFIAIAGCSALRY